MRESFLKIFLLRRDNIFRRQNTHLHIWLTKIKSPIFKIMVTHDLVQSWFDVKVVILAKINQQRL